MSVLATERRWKSRLISLACVAASGRYAQLCRGTAGMVGRSAASERLFHPARRGERWNSIDVAAHSRMYGHSLSLKPESAPVLNQLCLASLGWSPPLVHRRRHGSCLEGNSQWTRDDRCGRQRAPKVAAEPQMIEILLAAGGQVLLAANRRGNWLVDCVAGMAQDVGGSVCRCPTLGCLGVVRFVQ